MTLSEGRLTSFGATWFALTMDDAYGVEAVEVNLHV
jgi:hypothetical protein